MDNERNHKIIEGMKVTNTQTSASVAEECIERFAELNKCINPKWRFILMKLNDNETSIIVDHCEPTNGTNTSAMDNLTKLLSDQHPMWIAYNFPYLVQGGGKRNKVAIIRWCPDTLTRETLKESARVKMHAVGCGGKVKAALKGAVCFIQANSPEEVSFDVVMEKVSRHEREPINYEESKLI